MAFAVGLELFVSGAWADITPDLSDDGVSITRGRQNEGAQVDPARMACRLRNTDGKYSPRNPRSPLYGLIGRNTPIRFWEETGEVRLVQDAATQWSCPDSANLSITGDIDLRVDIAPRTWRPDAATYLGLIKGSAYWLGIGTDGRIILGWHDGTEAQGLTSSVPAPGGITGRKAIRATLDVDNGSGVAAATFYTSDSLTGTWAQLGAVVEHDDTTQINDSTETLGTYIGIPAELFGIEVRQGIAGTVRASVDWTDVTSGVTTYTDGQSNVWTPTGNATVTNRHYRFVGEVTAWPQRWTIKGASTVHAPIECAGVLRRIGQGNSPLQSAMRRGCEALPNLVGYWPMEDAEGARSLQAVVGTQSGRLVGDVDVAAFTGFDATDHLPTLGTGRIYCAVSPYSESGEAQIRWLSSAPDSGVTTDNAVMLRVRTASSLGWVDVHYKTDGGWYAKAYTNLGVLGHTTATLASAFNGKDMRLSLELKQNGSGVDITLVSVEAGQSSGVTLTETKAGITLGRITSVDVNPDAADVGSLAVGHLTVEKGITTIFDLTSQFAAYAGERADTRLLRLADENGISLAVVGAGAGCERMGPQRIDDLTALLRECATSDGGILYEPRVDNALRYRSLESLWSQDPAVTIAYTDNLLQPFEPVDDDEATRNRVTVTRAGGGSYTVEDATGPIGTGNPPDGVGIYDEAVTLSLATDAAAEQQAGWRVHLGTVDEARWPSIGLDLAHPTFVADPAMTRRILTLDIGDRLDVEDLPTWLPPFPVRQIIQGYTETITPPEKDERGRSSTDPAFHHRITFNCTPARPYNVGTYVASGYETTTTGVPAVPSTVLKSDDGTGKSDGTAWDTAKWTTEGTTSGGGTATYQSTALYIRSGNAGGYSGTNRTSRSWNITSRADGEVTGTFKCDGNEPYPLVMARATTSGVDYPNGYYLQLNKSGAVRIGKTVSYSGTTLDTGTITPASNTTYGFRFRVVGTSLKANVWSGTEPGDPNDPAYAWDMSVTDSTFTSAGKWGITVGAGNAATYHGVTFDNLEINQADGTADSTETSVEPIDAGPSDTRYGSGGSQLNTALSIDGTSAAVQVVEGPAWTEEDADLPLDLIIGGEQVTATAIGSPSGGVQTFTLTRAVNDVSKAHAAGTPVELLDPVFWGARPLGGALYSGGPDTGGGGGEEPDTETPNTVRIGTATYPLSGYDPGTGSGWGGDAGYPGDRGVDQLIVYTSAYGAATDTNQWGIECPTDSDKVVNSQNDRQASQSLTGTTIPASGFVLSGHGAARDWLLANATVGATFELIYVAPGGGGTGGGEGGGGGGGGTIGSYPSKMISIYKMIFSNTGPNLNTLDPPVGEVRLSFANGSPLGLVGYGSEGATSLRAAVASQRALGVRIVVSIGGAGYTVSLSNTSAFVSQFQAIVTDLGGCDGLDWDIESSAFNRANVVTISKALKSIYGSAFAITMAPNGSNVGAYLPAAVELHQNNALDNYGQQFYDAPVSLSAAKGRIAEAINAGIPASKISVGMMIANDSSHWTNAQCASYMADIKASYGVTKAYLWEAQRSGTSQWITDMNNIL